jgi:muramoyltetrapeptide carboxypeptidase
MITPPYLKTGDKIAIIATARKVSPSDMEAAFSTFRSWGLQVVTGPHLFGENNQYSGTDEERAADLQMMLDDKDIKAIVCARGGYGTVRIIDMIDFSAFEQHPKWIVGYSDATVLHSHIQTQFGIETLHAIMPINFTEEGSETAIETLRKALFGETLEYSVSPQLLNKPGNAAGVLTGGNLSILYALTGTPSDIVTEGKILFIEDLDEYLYHVDRMMMNLKRSGKLTGLKAIIVGGMTKMNDNAVPFGKQAEHIISDYAAQAEIPVCFNFPAGHMADNRALIMGREVQLNIETGKRFATVFTCRRNCKTRHNASQNLKTSTFLPGIFRVYLCHSISDKTAFEVTFEPLNAA